MQLGRSPTIKEVSMIILAIFSGAMEGIVEEKQRNPLLGIDFSSILFHILAGIIGVIWVFGLTYIVLVGFFRDEIEESKFTITVINVTICSSLMMYNLLNIGARSVKW